MTADQSPSLRERNKARARAEIASAALRLFTERGFGGVTIDEIVTAAGVSRRTFFRYFETKEDALLADYPELNIRLTEGLNCGADDLVATVRAGLHRLADWYVERSEAVLERSRLIRDGIHLAARNLEFLAQWERAIAATVSAHMEEEEPGGLVARTVAASVVGAFRSALTQWVRSSCAEDLHGLTDRALDVVLRGLASVTEADETRTREPATS